MHNKDQESPDPVPEDGETQEKEPLDIVSKEPEKQNENPSTDGNTKPQGKPTYQQLRTQNVIAFEEKDWNALNEQQQLNSIRTAIYKKKTQEILNRFKGADGDKKSPHEELKAINLEDDLKSYGNYDSPKYKLSDSEINSELKWYKWEKCETQKYKDYGGGGKEVKYMYTRSEKGYWYCVNSDQLEFTE